MKVIKLICPICNKKFNRSLSLHKFNLKNKRKIIVCSRKCYGQLKTLNVRKNIDIEDVIDIYKNQTIGMATISKKYAVSEKVIRDILFENNIEIRSVTWALHNKPHPTLGRKRPMHEKEMFKQLALKAYEKDPTIKDKIRQKTLEQINQGRMPKSNTSIEKIMANLLTELKISFEFQKIFGYWCYDFYLPKYKLFIECDGDYWHAHPDIYGKNKKELNETQKNNIKRGKAKETYVKSLGYDLIRFWECDINNNLQQIKNNLCKTLTII